MRSMIPETSAGAPVDHGYKVGASMPVSRTNSAAPSPSRARRSPMNRRYSPAAGLVGIGYNSAGLVPGPERRLRVGKAHPGRCRHAIQCGRRRLAHGHAWPHPLGNVAM